MSIRKVLLIQFYFLATLRLYGQLLDSNIQHPVSLNDGARVILIPSAEEPTHYYYIPETIQLSTRKGIPEASLLFYRDNDNGFDGGIMHVLLTWGLTADQERAVRHQLLKIDTAGVLIGGAELLFQDEDYLKLQSETSLAKIFDRSSTNPIRISPQNSSKTAASFRFSGDDAAQIHKAIHAKASTKNMFSIGYQYRIAENSGYLRVGVERKGIMYASIDQWIKTLLKYNLIKYTSI
jgi:hypothetical protein